MSDHLLYAYQKYGDAVFTLATGIGDIRSRLRRAAREYLIIVPEMVPDEDGVRDDIAWINAELTRFPKGAGSVEDTLFRIRNRTGKRIAVRVCEVYGKLEQIVARRSDERADG